MGVLVIFNIQLTAEQIEVLGQGLDEVKFKIAKPVAEAMQAQINEQIAAAQAAQAAEAEKGRLAAKAAADAAARAQMPTAPIPDEEKRAVEFVPEPPAA